MLRIAVQLVVMGLLALGASGCVERTLTIRSEPSDALVHLNDVEVGRTPVTVPFRFYGVYDVRIEKEGHQTLHAAADAEAPWWELPGPDLFAEILPGDREVNLAFSYELEPAEPVDDDLLLDHAKQLRATFRRGQGEDEDSTEDEPAGDDSSDEGQ